MSTLGPASSQIDVKERIIVALDVDSEDAARSIVGELAGSVGAFKVGLQLFSACGPELVREFASAGHKIFLDLKFHDIPNTVAQASREATRLGVWMFNLHASGGSEMMRAARLAVDEVCLGEDLPRPLVVAVTVLTSSTSETLQETGISADPERQVTRLARLTAECGLDGIVASAREAKSVRSTPETADLSIVTPGIRAANATLDDQRRVTTLGQAIAAGSTYAVVGRPITAKADRKGALAHLLAECELNAE